MDINRSKIHEILCVSGLYNETFLGMEVCIKNNVTSEMKKKKREKCSKTIYLESLMKMKMCRSKICPNNTRFKKEKR